jgi:hypothetical protein
MRSAGRHVVQLLLAVAAAAAAVLCWSQVMSMVEVAPVTEGELATTSAVYDPPMLLLTLLLATTAGVLAVLGLAGLRRAVTHPTLDTNTP